MEAALQDAEEAADAETAAETAAAAAELKLKLSSGLVMAISELRISGVLGVWPPIRRPLLSIPSSEEAGMLELNMAINR